MSVDIRALHALTTALSAWAGNYQRMRRAVENGAELLRAGRCELLDEESIRVYSDSGEVYVTSLRDCVNENTGDLCPAWYVGMPCKHRASLHLLRILRQGDLNGEHKCCGCQRRFRAERLMPVNWAALRAGEIVPSGVCPLCGFFCYPRAASAAAA